MRKWVLIVDDEDDLRETIRTHIELNYGDLVRIVEAADGVEATTKLHFQAFNCIITDISMPRKDGFKFIADVRRSTFNEHTPVVIISGHLDDKNPVEEQHVVCLHKPFNSKDLIAILDSQFKLGRTDSRVAADLVNTFISSGMDFLNSATQLECQQGEPSAKAAAVAPAGEHHQLVRLKVGKTVNQFAFCFSDKLVTHILEKGLLGTNLTTEKLLAAASQAIVRFSIKALAEDSIEVESNEAVNEHLFKLLRSNAGINIPIVSEAGDFSILAVWQKKK